MSRLQFLPALTPCQRTVIAAVLLSAFAVLPAAPGQDAGADADDSLPQADSDPQPADGATVDSPERLTVAELAAKARLSLVTVAHYGRDGTIVGSGSGFVVDEGGLIATCFHVIGEARRISVTFADGRQFDVAAVHAFDRKLDLAVLRIDAAGLPVIPLAPPDSLRQGEKVVAMGNPEGLEFSVVEGVLSAVRDFDAGPMLQLAIPVERGNSGGPILDLSGRVHGLMSVKSTVTENLGFATPSAALRPLLDQPNPIPMHRWLTIGALDTDRWEPLMGARWRQRAGRIIVEEAGGGFGGRSLCLWRRAPDDEAYEVAVQVRLNDESGAAGLVFASDRGDRHYGFYPSGGSMRLTRFDGPTVYEWTILDQVATPAYRPGEWNHLRIRVTPDRIEGWVNGRKVVERDDAGLRGGHCGLAKFRDTVAEFREFAVGNDLAAPSGADPVTAERLRIGIASMPATAEPDADLASTLEDSPDLARRLLEERARELVDAADAVRDLASRLHASAVARRLTQAVEEAEIAFAETLADQQPAADGPDLATIALLIALLDNPELNLDAYLSEIDSLAGKFLEERAEAAPDAPPPTALDLVEFLFRGNGFHGSRSEYYHRSNSYLNEVIDDREGIPLTLSVLFLEVARRAGIDGVFGLGLPGHFIVKAEADDGSSAFIDAFDEGRVLSAQEADLIVRGNGDAQGTAVDYAAASPREIAARMLTNLKVIAIEKGEWSQARSYADLLVALDPGSASERLSRALIHVQSRRLDRAREDFEWILQHEPEGIDLERIRQFLDYELQ